jgi:hypothetical protein
MDCAIGDRAALPVERNSTRTGSVPDFDRRLGSFIDANHIRMYEYANMDWAELGPAELPVSPHRVRV